MKIELNYNHPVKGIINYKGDVKTHVGENANQDECEPLRVELGLPDNFQLFTVEGILFCCMDGDIPADIGRVY